MVTVVDDRKNLVERDLVASVRGAAKLLVGGVGGDPVDPRSQSRSPPERVDLADHVPERVLDGFLGIRPIPCDPDRQAIRAVAVGGDETLGGGRLAQAQRLHELLVTIDSHRSGRRGFCCSISQLMDFHDTPAARWVR